MPVSPIRILSKEVVNRIAAGEVIERPASVVKELVENSLDGDASRIQIWIEKGGKKSIKVTDNGTGMGREDLVLAFLSHATSKLTRVEDLSHIATLGFRGEALSSIGAVGEARILSKFRGEGKGYSIENRGGLVGQVQEAGVPEGTTVDVKNLFFNLPAREKFLKSEQAELAHVIETVTRFAIRHFSVHFELYHNGRRIFNLPPAPDFRARLLEFFGGDLEKNLLPLEYAGEWFHVSGFTSSPVSSFPSSKKVFFFLNDRFIRDRMLTHALLDGYKGALGKGRWPASFVLFQMDPGQVDVNVHPTKIEVRFRNSRAVHQGLLQAVRKALEMGDKRTPPVPAGKSEPGMEFSLFREKAFSLDVWDANSSLSSQAPSSRPPLPVRKESPVEGLLFPKPQPLPPSLQIHRSFLVVEIPGGFAILDQHALHERIVYERISHRLEKGSLPQQQLLIPEVVDFTFDEVELLLANQELLRRFGIDVVSFGAKAVALQSLPPFIAPGKGRELIQEIVANLQEERGEALPGRLEGLKKVMACKGAVKAGEPLNEADLAELIPRALRSPASLTCPHGRPAGVVFTLEEIRKWFQRK